MQVSSHFVAAARGAVGEDGLAWLVGNIESDIVNVIHPVRVVHQKNGKPEWDRELSLLSVCLPAGLTVVGVVLGSDKHAADFLKANERSMKPFLGKFVLVNSRETFEYFIFDQSGLVSSQPSIRESSSLSTAMPAFDIYTLKCQMPVPIVVSKDTASAWKEQSELKAASLSQTRLALNPNACPDGYNFAAMWDKACTDSGSARELFTVTATDNKGGAGSKKKQGSVKESLARADTVVGVELLNASASDDTAPLLCYQPGPARHKTFNVDVVVYVSLTSTAGDVVELVQKAVASQLIAQVSAFSSHAQCEPEAFHFDAGGLLPFYVTSVYALPTTGMDPSEPELESVRRELHDRFLLPTRPLLRTASAAFRPPPTVSGKAKLKNVHVGLPPSGVVGGTLYLVDGVYDYHHYMQDQFDDNGWGCAYRSFQTIISWFRNQYYTSRDIPGHREIQETLVKAGDKPQKFVGSREWIGAFEINILMDVLLGVQCKILAVNSGADLEQQGRALAQHFVSQGTPVMVGGGVLAYTLLGIDFNSQTGDIRFLILDPHYTGGEDLRTIQRDKWVGWHKASLFRADSFYNLCMPQRPDCL